MDESRADRTGQDRIPGTVIHFGADYNPEQWEPEVWREDVRLMQQAGVTMVSLGIWSWALLEPEPGRFDFTWFDEIVGLLKDAGIGIDLATPTAAPPAWFYRQHPEARLVEADGRVRYNGSRGICCPHSPAYAEACARITEAIFSHVAGDPGIVMGHVHNEYGAPGGDCHCETSQQAFRSWLGARYASLEDLNRAWGTAFWGQTYGDWEEIGTPRHTGADLNPACQLDFARFTSDSLLARFTAERDIIRRHFRDLPVTTNFMATNCPANDYWTWSQEMDVVSTDYYLEADSAESQIWLAMESDLTRSLAGGRPWFLMEHSVSGVSWQPHNRAKLPGEETRNAIAHVARGADAVLAFQWRQSRRGVEKFHSAMVPHVGPDSRVFREVCDLGAKLDALAPVRGSRLRARVAILWDWNSFWAQDLPCRHSVLMRHREQMRRVYRWLWQRGTLVDFVHPESGLEGYDVVIAPASYLLSEVAAQGIARFVDQGGRFAALPFSAVVDDEDCVHEGGAPGPLRTVLGLTVEEVCPIPIGHEVALVPTDGGTAVATGALWAEDLRLEGARAVWTATGGPVPGPVVTVNDHGRGYAVYVSTVLESADLATVLEPLLQLPSVAPLAADAQRPASLEVVTRVQDDGEEFVFVINHGEAASLPGLTGEDLLTGTHYDGTTPVPAGGVLVLRIGA